MTHNISTRPNSKTIRWTEEEGETFYAEDGKTRLEVFPAPFKAEKWCWRHLRMSSGLFWKTKNGGIADSIEAAMTAAGMAMAGNPKEWATSTKRVR